MHKLRSIFKKLVSQQVATPPEKVIVDSDVCRQLIRDQYTVRYHESSPAPEVTCEPFSDPKNAILKLIAVAFSEIIPTVKVKKQTFMDLGVVRYVEWNSGEHLFQIKASIRTADKWEQDYAKSTTHLKINGKRCFSGSLYRFNGVVLDGSIHHFGNINYLRTPVDWVKQVNEQSIPTSEAIFGIDLGEWDEFSGRHTDWTSLYEKYPEK